MKSTLTASALLCLITAQPLIAAPSEILSFEGISPRVRKYNPELAAARFRIDEAIGLAKQSGRLSNPSLIREYPTTLAPTKAASKSDSPRNFH
jgi:hypothetical protein